jgi:prepilin-type N-terminal cleavage/methylation domain-containing protein
MTRGYSLLELIVALAIAAAIVVIATPAVQASVDRMTLSADVRTVMTALRRLREEASDRQVDITLGAPGGAGNLIAVSTGETLALTAGTVVRVAPAQGVVVAWDGTIRGTLRLSRGPREATVAADLLTGRLVGSAR